MSDLLGDWWVHQVVVSAYEGSGAYGDIYGPAVTLSGLVDDSNKLITGATGEQVVSSARVFLPPGSVVPLGSKVTLGAPFLPRSSHVIAMSVHDGGSQPTPNHVEIALL